MYVHKDRDPAFMYLEVSKRSRFYQQFLDDAAFRDSIPLIGILQGQPKQVEKANYDEPAFFMMDSKDLPDVEAAVHSVNRGIPAIHVPPELDSIRSQIIH